MLNELEHIQLIGANVVLQPLQLSHRDDLLSAATDGKLWDLWYTSVPSPDSIDSYLEVALAEKSRSTSLPFTVLEKASNKIVGSTRYLNIDHQHHRLEIGNTWYAKAFQRTAINTECKFLLLRFAFENLDCIAVEFRTHWHNHRSRNAILRLGAKMDGVLRNHRIEADGSFRDTVVYSIIRGEWPTVKKSLLFKLNR